MAHVSAGYEKQGRSDTRKATLLSGMAGGLCSKLNASKQPEEKLGVTVSQSERSGLTVVGCTDGKGVGNLSKPKPADEELKNPRSGILQVEDRAVVSPKDQSGGGSR